MVVKRRQRTPVLLLIMAGVLPWLLELRFAVAWLLAAHVLLVPSFMARDDFNFWEALFQSMFYVGFSAFVLITTYVARQQAQAREDQRRQVKTLPTALRKSLTWDRGGEMASHKNFTVATDTQVYFCDPQSPWQRGSNENTNGLLRQYFPDGTDLSRHSQAFLNKIARRLNERPRKTLGFQTPAAKLSQAVASTG